MVTAVPVNVAKGLAVVAVATSPFGFVEMVTVFVLVGLGGRITVLLLTNGGVVKLVEVIVVVFNEGGKVVVKFRVLVMLI